VVVATQDSPQCVTFTNTGALQQCTPDGSTRDAATTLDAGIPSVWFYAAAQEYWFTYTVEQDSNVVWQLYSIGGGPYIETTVFPNNPNAPALAYWRHADRDDTAVETVDRFDLGAISGGTILDIRLLVLEWPSEEEESILVRPIMTTSALESLPQASDVCGENCEALCEVWGGIDLERQAEGKPTFVCNPNLAPVECQCFCKDFTVGDFDGTRSCVEDDENSLKGGAIAGIVVASLAFVVCIILLVLKMQRNPPKEIEKNSEKEAAPLSRGVVAKDDSSQTELDTEHQNDEESFIKKATPAQLWDSVLTLPGADVVYTKVTENEDGTVLVKRKFRLHKPNEKGKVSQRMKLLFPDTITAAHHGFIATPFKKSGRMASEPSETTESESEVEHTPIQEIPSLLSTTNTSTPPTSPKKNSSKNSPSETWSKKKLQPSTSRIVAEIEKRMAAEALKARKPKKKKNQSQNHIKS
jgi:hypothetical protein